MENGQAVRSAIEEYFGRGWECIPVRLWYDREKDKKVPMFSKRGWKTAYTLNEALESIQDIDATGVAIKTGSLNNILILEIDHPSEKGIEYLEENGIELLSDTYSVGSQNKGVHYYFEWDSRLDKKVTTKARIFGESIPIDLRGDGGIIYAPPTYVIGGGNYRILNNGVIRKPPESLVAKLLQILPSRIDTQTEADSVSLERIEGLLSRITDNGAKRLSYDDWLYTVSCVWSVFSLEESLPLLRRYLPEERHGELEKKYPDRLPRVMIGDLNKLAIRLDRQGQESIPDVFYVTSAGKFRLDAFKIVTFLEQNGFGKFKRDGNIEFVKVRNNVVYPSSIIEMKDFIRQAIEKGGRKESLLSQLFTVPLFRTDRIDGIREIMPDFHRSSLDKSYLYFQNGFLEITATTKGFHPYSDLDKPIRESQIIKHDFRGFHLSPKVHNVRDRMQHTHEEGAGDAEMLVDHTCSMDPARIRAIRSAIGYLCHPAKDPSLAKAILLLDERVSDNASGRSGKSLIARMISHVRNAVVQDGKQFYTMDRFKFDRVNSDTDVLIFDDVEKDFVFEILYNGLSEGFECRKRYKDTFRIEYEDSPKVLLTSNFAIIGNSGDSDKGRRAEYELYPWYDLSFTPKHDFGKLLFVEWDPQEWNRFYCFIIKCVQVYLRDGLIEIPPINAQYRKLVQSTSDPFAEWCKEFFYRDGKLMAERFNISFRKEDLLNDFFRYAPEYEREQKYGKFSRNKFTKWLKVFCDLYMITTIEEQKRIEGSSGQYCITFKERE